MSQSNGIIRVKQADGTYKTVNSKSATTVNDTGKTITQILAEDVAEKNHLHNYKSDVPSTATLGGVEKGFITDGVCVEEMLYKLLHPHVNPSITLTTEPNGVVYEIGSTIESINFTVDVKAQSNIIQAVRLYKNDEVIQTVEHKMSGDCIFNYTEKNLATNATFKADVYDGVNTVSTTSISFIFLRPVYMGILPANISEGITEDMISNLSKKIMSHVSFCNSFTLEDSRMCVAVPPGWSIRTIFDHNGFDITRSFDVQSVDVVCLDGQTITYTFYISDVTSQSSYNIKFIK